MSSNHKLITIIITVLMLFAGCQQTTFAPAPQATASPAPAITPTQITVIATSTSTAAPIPTNTPKPNVGTVLLIFGQNFIYDIYTVVKPALEEAGYRVVVASRTMGPLKGKGVNQEVSVDLLLQDVQVKDYDAILFNCDNDITFGSARAETDRIAQEATKQGKVVGAICSGPRVLAYAKVVEGKKTTGEPSQTCQMLEQSGATCTGATLERDGSLITARDRYASRAYVQAIIEAMQEQSVTPSPSHSDQGLIAFVSTRDGNGEIYTVNADGSNPRRLTNWRQWDGYPAWSPDGSQIAYYSYLSAKSWVIKVINVDGSNSRQLTSGDACDGAPYWSPSGDQIAYSSDAECNGDHREIYVIDVAGGTPRNLSNNAADDMAGTWSPDGTQILFSSNRDGNYELYIMHADGSNVRRLTNAPGDDHAPAWSPNGTQIAFYSNRDGNDEIYVMASDGSNVRRLTDNAAADWFPRWSPDGRQITFSSKRDGNLEIYAMDADGSNVRRLTNDPGDDFNSVWQPRLPDGTSSTPKIKQAIAPTTSPTSVPDSSAAPISFTDSGQLLGSARSWDVKLGDLDGDGDLDAFVANGSQGDTANAIWLNDGHGIFTLSEQRLGYGMGVELGDLDGDGDLDAFVTDWDKAGEVWLNDGSGIFADSEQSLGNRGGFGAALGDLDGDGDLDAFVAQEKANTVWLNDGDGTFTDTGQSLGVAITADVALGDLDGDGDLDALTGGWDEPAKVWLNDGNGTFADSGHDLSPGSVHIHGLALGNVDGDGDLDMFMAIASGDPNQVWLNDGTGIFADSGQRLPGSLAQDISLGDLDGDGDLDAFVAHGDPWRGSSDTVWLNDGNGTFTDSELRLGELASYAVELGDLDRDGDLDAFVAHSDWQDSKKETPNQVWLNGTRN